MAGRHAIPGAHAPVPKKKATKAKKAKKDVKSSAPKATGKA